MNLSEWLLTNGLGSFASGTVADVRTRTYHGWLFAAINPPSERKLLLSHLEASLEINDIVIALGTNIWSGGKVDPQGYQLLSGFELYPVPTWTWKGENWQLTRRLIMPYGYVEKESELSPYLQQKLLIHYSYQGQEKAVLKLRLLIGDRDFHHQQTHGQELQFSQLLVEKQQLRTQAIKGNQFGTSWHLRWTKGEYQPDGLWYWNYSLLEETKRGLGDQEDLYSPGYLTVHLQREDTVTLEAKVGLSNSPETILSSLSFAEALAAEEARLNHIFNQSQKIGQLSISLSPLKQQLLKAGDQFIVYRASIAGPTIIAGYHWFNDWGGDTLIALPGLALVTQRFDLAKGLLKTFGLYCRHGLIPNAFPDINGEPFYNSIDATLWWIETLGLYLEATQDWQFLAAEFPIIQQIHKAFVSGTSYNIHVDATDGLVSWDTHGVALTWMDAIVDGLPVTPRRGKPVEINALWYSALCWLSKWAEKLSQLSLGDTVRLSKQGQHYATQAQQVKASLQKFWHLDLGYLYDTIEPDDHRNSQIRPNAILALSLYHCAFSSYQGQQIVKLATDRLLTPYGLRSLDPRDPEYIGTYQGEPEKRDRAYHQGTVWAWLIGPYIRAWQRFYPEKPLPFDWQPLIEHFLYSGCLGSISEIFDGDAPHLPKGAIAQAWSVAEVIRHL
ncbi:MAG: amylo-alpha-1,6-glucosidase [Cuspidothrix sp.]